MRISRLIGQETLRLTQAHGTAPVDGLRLVKRLRPQISPWAMTRSRLLTQLDDAAGFPLTFLSAPAGYGKTTLLSQWVSMREEPVPWVSLDAADNSISRLVTTVVGAIQKVEPFVGNRTLSILNTSNDLDPSYLASVLIDEVATIAHAITIVLDDFHVLDDDDVLQFFESLFRIPAPNLHVIVGSRYSPPFPTAYLRGYGHLVEIETASVAFTPEESRDFLGTVARQPLTSQEVEAYVSMADGWPAALQVIALSLGRAPVQSHGTRSLHLIRGNFRTILLREVFDHLPARTQQQLVRVAIPERISPDLAQVLMDAGPPIHDEHFLQSISDSGLFLSPLGTEGDWYHFHSLFRDSLLAHLHQTVSADEVSTLHLRASQWFLEHNDVSSAISHAVWSGRTDRAARIVASHAQGAFAADRWIEVEQWISLLDEKDRRTNVEVMVANATILQTRARYDQLTDEVARIRTRLASTDGSISAEARRLHEADLASIALWAFVEEDVIDRHIATIRAAYDVVDGTGRYTELFSILVLAGFMSMRDPDATQTWLVGIRDACQSRDDTFSRLKLGWVYCAMAFVNWNTGTLPEIVASARLSLAIATSLQAGRLESQANVFLGLALYERNDLAGAEQCFRAVANNPRSGGIFLTVGVTRLAICLNAMGSTIEADNLMESHLDRLLETGNTDIAFIHRSAMARIAYSRDQFSTALALIDAIPLTPAHADTRSMEIPWLFKATLLYQRGSDRDVREADLLLNATEQAIAGYNAFRFQVALRFARVLRAHRHGDEVAARRQFHDLMLKTERAGFVRTLLDLGETFRYLLDRYGSDTPYARMLKQAQSQAPSHDAPRQSVTVLDPALSAKFLNPPELAEPLTYREIDMLEGLQNRLSNKEIAYNLSISPLTVKTHLRNLYEKLGVNSRRQAIARATSLGILE